MKKLHLWVNVIEHFGAEVVAQNENEDEGDYTSIEIPHNYAMTDDDCDDPKLVNYGKEFVLPSDPLEKIKLEKGMLFFSVDAFRLALREYAIRGGFKVIRDKNEKKRIAAYCDGKGCKWKIH
ncbi:UNVERIFIED_CONTAM: hypothetical protein Sradi_0670800 [Sesamum radiatum]|uniref:Transposase MuDR plant domain-containing protein n=1 Tax=Sesamum radiatum TaxID=300843 RepID=A0AAW2VMC2_SESRA